MIVMWHNTELHETWDIEMGIRTTDKNIQAKC